LITNGSNITTILGIVLYGCTSMIMWL